MRYKNSDDNRYRVQFMRSTEELMDQLTVKEFISYLEENAEFEDYTVEYIDKKCVKCRAYDLTEENSKLHKEFLVTEDGRVFYWRSLISKIELVDAEEEKQEVSKMVIKRLKGAKFGTDRIARVVTGYALYEEGKGYMSIHGVNARQLQIISILKEAKCTNTAELQEELGVSRRTLRTDIAYLKRVYPDKLITHRGRYTGGLEWVE